LDLKDSADEMRREHLALVQALSERNADLAEKLARVEIESSKERVLAALKQEFAPRGSLSRVERR